MGIEHGDVGALLLTLMHDVQNVARVPAQPVQACDHEFVTKAEKLKDRGKLRAAVAACARDFLGSDGEIATKRSKTGEPVFGPIPTELAAVLASAPKHYAMTLRANSVGHPWTESGFRASWRPLRLRLEKEGRVGPGLTLYGLRKTVAVILREIGYDERTIADALGQKTIEMARHYAKAADLRPKMRGVVASFESELNKRRTKAVKPGG